MVDWLAQCLAGLCPERPENNALYVSVLEYANKVWGKFSIGYGILMMWRLMVPFLIAAATGLLLSLGYVALLKDYAPTLSKIGIRLIVLVPWVWAGYLWYKHGQGALLPCVALVVVGVCIGCCAASRMHELDKAAACIKLSCTCVYQTPMLHFGPCVVLLFRVASGFGILCFIILAHTGIFVDFLERGLITFRCSAQKQDDCIYDLVLFVLWLAMFVWIQILFTASWEFAVAYLAAEWYVEGGVHEKTGKDGFRQCCKQCHVWWVLFRYHFGTMIKASIFIGAIRPFRAVLGSLTAVARLEGNPVGSILNCCCGCFVDIYEQYFEKFSVNAYIEVAVSAMNLDHAAFEASEVCERQKGTASSLNGTTFIFQLVGLTLVWWAGYFVMWMIVSGSCPGLRQYGDVYSPHYVGHQGFWSNAGGIIALTAAFPAMMVFDVVSDTILYCVMVDVMQNESKATSYWSSMPRGVLELLDLINSWTSIFSSGSSSGSSSSASSSSGE
ncbi:Choline transporter-like protein 4 (Solute carrier family 44 member 4) (Thiamine pyrophosphate transporter 1) [Durusdinium trenchii]|uniref:Choline transporter-like protein n=2 Tax=Durusdinium trenchii TaxID=1381693 RepID=A0ABP0H932_9DINO